MGILDVCLKRGKHIATIMLLCEGGRITGEGFGFEDIEYIAGYRGVAFRVKVRHGKKEKDYITRRIDFPEGEQGMAVFRVEKGGEEGKTLRLPVSAIVEIVSQE
jgi:hypothetical protein